MTAGVLAGAWLIIQSEPSATSADSATWGPYTDELDPATYRFRITRVATDEYDYVLEGRPKASTSDADYRAVLTGNGFVVESLHELYAPARATTPDYYEIATAEWAQRWPVEDLWSARLA